MTEDEKGLPVHPTKQTVNSVRQVLMNELGLTREEVRKLTEDIVVETVERHLSQENIGYRIDIAINNALKGYYGDKKALESFIASSVRAIMAEAIRKELQVEVTASLKHPLEEV